MSAAAFFDVDGTLTDTTIVAPLGWYQRAHLPLPLFCWRAFLLLPKAPYYLWIDRRSRARFNVAFYRRYAGLPIADLRDWHRRTFADNLQKRIYPAALECLRGHQRRGDRVVLVTGGLDFVMQPLADYLGADALLAARLEERDGVCTGSLVGPPVADARKAELVREWAGRAGVDLGRSAAYGNSVGDLPMLECVGRPVAVNPDGRLRRLAAARGWETVRWGLEGAGGAARA